MMVQEVDVEEALVEQYERDGAVVVRQVFHHSWLDKIQRGIAKNLDQPSQYSERLMKGHGAYFNDYCNWSWVDEFRDFVYNSPAAALAARFMRSSQVSFYHEHVLNKEPGTTKCTPWHHDQSYYPIDGKKVCSLWMPVDPVAKETCVKFVGGSHLWPKWFIPRKFASELNYPLQDSREKPEDGDRRYYDVPVEEIEANKWPILQWQCEPGDVVVFHMKTLHGADGNNSTAHRRVLSTRWLGDDAVMATRPWDVSPPITGGLKPGERAVCDTFPLVYTRH